MTEKDRPTFGACGLIVNGTMIRLLSTGLVEVGSDAGKPFKGLKPAGTWNRFLVRVKGGRMSVNLNNKPVVEDMNLSSQAPREPIGLYGDGPVEFANIFIRE